MATEKINQFISYNLIKEFSIEEIVEFLIEQSNVNNTDERSSFIEAVSKIRREELTEIVSLLSNKVQEARNLNIKVQSTELEEKKQVLGAMKEALEKNILGSLVDFDNQIEYFNYLLSVEKIDQLQHLLETARINYDKARLNYSFLEIYYSTLIDTLTYKIDKRKSKKTIDELSETAAMKKAALSVASNKLSKAHFDYMTAKMKSGLITAEAWEDVYEYYAITRDEFNTNEEYIDSVKKK